MRLKVLISISVLVVLSFIVSNTVNFNELFSTLQQFPVGILALCLVLATLLSVLKTWRLMVLLSSHNIELAFFPAFRMFLASQAITPLPGGEASRAVLISNETGKPVKEAAVPVLIQALLELFSAVVLAILGSLLYRTLLGPGIAALCILVGIVVILTHSGLLSALLHSGARFNLIKKHTQNLLNMQKTLQQAIFKRDSFVPTTALVYAFCIALFTNFVGGVLLMLIALGYGENISLFQATFVYSAGTAIQGLATISPGGLGFTEGGMIGLLSFFNVSQALAIVVIFRFATFLYYIVLGLVVLAICYRGILLQPRGKGVVS